MKTITLSLLIFSLASCTKQTTDPKAELIRILDIQESIYDDQSAENKQRFIETCVDSLIFIGGDDGGMAYTSKAYVADFADGYIKRPYERKIQIYDNTAIVTALQQSFKMLGTDTLLLNMRYSKVFTRENDQWKMAYVTYAPMAISYNKIVSVNPSQLEKYVGIYDLGTTGRDSVYIQNDKLYSSGSELLALNDSTFIGEGYFGKAIFAKTHYTFEWNDGQRIRFSKIK